jgi:hypothetical protein
MRPTVVLHGFKAVHLAGGLGRFYDNDDSPSEK